MKNINEVLHKLAETRLSCPTFIIDELERLYYESDENGMATALLEADLLATKKELAERDRTIAQYHTLIGEANEQSDKLIKEYKELATERAGLRKALEVATDALNGILNGEWSETLDDQFLEVFTTRRINPSQIADEALLEINRELEALGE